MTRDQERIMRDLATHQMQKTGRAAMDAVDLAKSAGIPEHDASLAAIGTMLFLCMDLMHALVPDMNAREFGVMAEQHFACYLKRERKTAS